jgi:hypothetical protein
MRAVDALTLAAVALVVLLVSLPRLRDLALRENEADAAWLARRLGELSVQDEAPTLGELFGRQGSLRRLAEDAELIEGGRVLRRHGYLFELLPGPRRAVRAWPWEAGRTGRVALLWTPEVGLVGHPNHDGRWSGDRPPRPEAAGGDGWRRVRGR